MGHPVDRHPRDVQGISVRMSGRHRAPAATNGVWVILIIFLGEFLRNFGEMHVKALNIFKIDYSWSGQQGEPIATTLRKGVLLYNVYHHLRPSKSLLSSRVWFMRLPTHPYPYATSLDGHAPGWTLSVLTE